MQDQIPQTAEATKVAFEQFQLESINQAMAKYMQAEEAAKEIRNGLIALIKPIVGHLKIRPDELDILSNSSSSLPPKFRNPVTGETWHGQGRRPSWIPKELKTKDIEQFRIKD